jgi:hypothetical protein
MQFSFGSGVFYGTPLTDASGNAIANPTPIKLGVLQDVSLDLSFDTKMLYGQQQFPVAVGRGKGKITLKSKFAQLNGASVNNLFFGQTVTNGVVADYVDTVGSLIPTTPYQITITPPASGTFAYDLGVRGPTGVPYTRVAASPASGQYSISGGVYTFAAADTGLRVYIDYQYTGTSTTATKGTVSNVLMGQAPFFKGDFFSTYAGKNCVFTFPQCLATKLTLASKQEDFMIPEFDIEGFADASGSTALYWAFTD